MTPEEELAEVRRTFPDALAGRIDILQWLVRATPFIRPDDLWSFNYDVIHLAEVETLLPSTHAHRLSSIRAALAFARVPAGPQNISTPLLVAKVHPLPELEAVKPAVLVSQEPHGGKDAAQKEAAPNKTEQSFAANGDGRRYFLEVVWTGGFGLFGALANNSDHKGYAVLFLALALCGMVVAATEFAKWESNQKRSARLLGFAVVLISAWFFAPGNPPKPFKPPLPPISEEPSRMTAAVRAATPVQQEDVGKSFVGAKVRWLLKLIDVHRASNSEMTAAFQDSSMFPPTIVAAVISEEDKNLMRLSKKGALVYVSGIIESVSSTGLWIKDVKLELPLP